MKYIIYNYMKIHPFKKYIFEQVKRDVQATGHMMHLADLVTGNDEVAADPDAAIQHARLSRDTLDNQDTSDDGHEAHVKGDGSASFLGGIDEEGKPFVSLKSGANRFYSHDDIRATGKDYHERNLIPAFNTVSAMKNMKPGTAFQADILGDRDEGTHHDNDTFTSNAVTYKTPSKNTFTYAPHSTYKVSGQNMIRTGNKVDHSQLETGDAYPSRSVQLDIDDDVTFDVSKSKLGMIDKHIDAAAGHLSDETRDFTKTLQGNTKFMRMFQRRSNEHHRNYVNDRDMAGSGKRSVDDLRSFVPHYVENNRRVKPALQQQEIESHTKFINDNAHHFDNIFNAQNSLQKANKGMVQQFNKHNDQYDLQTADGHNHEGFVSHLAGATSVKLVDDFAEKNAIEARRFQQ
jgi:hypothetical protein